MAWKKKVLVGILLLLLAGVVWNIYETATIGKGSDLERLADELDNR
ncbi:hypothetical protein [Laspinema olomoucense]|uniref:Uncharacterized protein n=1 Tax=Laspinema olomoucense D3b TaxID=2953688 RepID=A0ABT2NCK0_9CYAN|nr:MULTISPECIES: hypothetical protein [unclassified Laspinema]MCT7980428.1 hypothetical protein [Laspinema sp. D3b]MCT7996235.1 hypothetical protein [Laspinema sp. D3c]